MISVLSIKNIGKSFQQACPAVLISISKKTFKITDISNGIVKQWQHGFKQKIIVTFAKKRLEISNRKAYHEYFFEDKYIAGLVLAGTEIKSLRSGKASFNDSYCYFDKGELYVKSLYISEYSFGTYNNHPPLQERKLLLNKKELRKWEAKTKEKGYSIIPLKIFLTDKGIFKMEIGLGKGKKIFDKRETIKERENDRDIKRKYGI